MKPAPQHSFQQTPSSLLLTPKSETDNGFLQAEKNKAKDAFSVAFAIPQNVNDPAQWDEAWFANYE